MSLSTNKDKASKEDDSMKEKLPKLLTPGRAILRSWIGKYFRVVIADGRILIGLFNCTDKDANIVLSMCCEYIRDGGNARYLENVMIPKRHIVTIDVDLLNPSYTEII